MVYKTKGSLSGSASKDMNVSNGKPSDTAIDCYRRDLSKGIVTDEVLDYLGVFVKEAPEAVVNISTLPSDKMPE